MPLVAVISLPTSGGVISKSRGRIVCSLVRAIAAIVIAKHTFDEP